jgi:chemotaxis protein CheC
MDKTAMKDYELDALQEAGNIAAANAVSALSKLIDEKINMEITRCKLIKTEMIPYVLGDETKEVVAVNMLIPNRNLSTVLMFLPLEFALEYCDKFSKNDIGTTKEISYNEIVVLTEIGNICICSYLNALSKLLNLTLMPTPPAVACDTVGAILEDVAVSADVVNNYAILVETEFIHATTSSFKGQFLFIPDRDSKNAILNVFNVT